MKNCENMAEPRGNTVRSEFHRNHVNAFVSATVPGLIFKRYWYISILLVCIIIIKLDKLQGRTS